MTKSRPTSQSKADANRRNAAHSTGPRTPRGKAWSRLNAIKHGILASQTVITTIDGRAERKLFEATVTALALEFEPVSAFEQLLVQEVAAYFWRLRKLHMFEKRAAVEVRDRPITQLLNRLHDEQQPPPVKSAFYEQYGVLVTTEQVYDDSGLNAITLPSEADTMRIIRYQAAIIRARERAVKSLREMRKERGQHAVREPVAPVIDRVAARRNAGRGHATLLSVPFNLHAWRKIDEVGEEAYRMREAELRGQLVGEPAENYQTKPKTLSPEEKDRRLKASLYEVFGIGEPPAGSETAPEDPKKDPDKPRSS
jgi:hypothetical protein